MISEHTNQRFQFLLENTSEGFLEIDPKGTIVTANSAAENLTGWKIEELKGTDYKSFLDCHSCLESSTKKEVILYRKIGPPCKIFWRSTPLYNEEGLIESTLCLFHSLNPTSSLPEYDPITELPNRNLFYTFLDKILASSSHYPYGVSLLIIDLEHFKRLNNTFGYAIGDKVIQKVAQRLAECIRKGTLLARTEIDEFSIVLENYDDRSSATIAKKILACLEAPFHLQDRDFYLSANIGIASTPNHAQTLGSLIKIANIALSSAKKAGRNQYQFFTPELNQKISDQIILEHHLRKAIEQNEFSLAYQPKVDVQTREIIGAEALLRWNNFELGEIPPAYFIPIAEETGFIHPLGAWVIKTCCQQSQLWQKMKIAAPQLTVSVNLSMHQLSKHNLMEMISSILEETGCPPHQLEIELTESALMNNPVQNISVLEEAKQLGLTISVDDFGTGYSCLSHLKRLPLNIIKIDRSFIQDILSDPNDAIIASTIIQLSHGLGLKVIAEGVETEEQFNFLRDKGCDFAQGFYFSKPLPFGQFAQLLSRGENAITLPV
ncbi:MAG: EAL domain-containing protein [Gammaproteobacteria bacterium]|nr:EAL domain-containing protein [Gammaproteobacteria bacterium]